MWLSWLRKLLRGKAPLVEKSDLEEVREALRPSQIRTNPPKPSTRPPKIERRLK